MNKRAKPKPYWEMTTGELAQATKQFDSPDYNPPAVKATPSQQAHLRQWKRRRAAQRSTLTLSLDPKIIEQADQYAADHGMTFSDLVSNALRRLMRKKSA